MSKETNQRKKKVSMMEGRKGGREEGAGVERMKDKEGKKKKNCSV